jgi:hypothetical protein
MPRRFTFRSPCTAQRCRVLFLCTTAFAASGALPARAQTLPSLDTRTWRPSSDPQATLVLEPPSTPGPWQWNAGAWLSYAQAPVVLRDGGGQVVSRPVLHSFGLDLVAGIGLGERAALGVDIPLFLGQDGSSGLPATVSSSGSVPAAGIGDVLLNAKAAIVDNSHAGVAAGVGLAAVASVSLPTGDRTSFQGEGSPTASLRVLAEYAFAVGALRASLGYAARIDQRTWPDASVGGVTFGDAIPWSVGLVARPAPFLPSLDRDDRQVWELALHGAIPAGPVAPFGLGDAGASALSPVLLAIDDRIALGHYRDAFVLVGAEAGLDQAVGVPAVRGVVAFGWAPRSHDRDHDGVDDDRDECPDLAEDRDGIQDEDGCPEDDADGDGVLDTEDACPLVPGVWWNDRRRNGCPAPDTDGDGVPDPVDACPAVKGVRSDDPKKNGCPPSAQDRDADGIPDDADKCPEQAEDRDGKDDFDGCPDPDDDGDGIADAEDACPQEKGERSPDPSRNGCHNPDRDGDTFDDDVDACPDQPENFNGVKDDDGCPDQGGRPLAVAREKDGRAALDIEGPLAFASSAGATIDPKSMPTLRAVALELNRHPDWTLAIAVRPGQGKPADTQRVSLERAMTLANQIVALTHRPSSAEAVAWDAVKSQPLAATSPSGVVAVVLETHLERPGAALPEKAEKK